VLQRVFPAPERGDPEIAHQLGLGSWPGAEA
jgi:hypothetical protein